MRKRTMVSRGRRLVLLAAISTLLALPSVAVERTIVLGSGDAWEAIALPSLYSTTWASVLGEAMPFHAMTT